MAVSESPRCEFEFHMPQVFEFIAAKFLQFAISFVRKDRQTDRQTNKHPQPCSENKPFGNLKRIASRQLGQIENRMDKKVEVRALPIREIV